VIKRAARRNAVIRERRVPLPRRLGGHEGRISISPIGVMPRCDLPPRPLALTVEWATLHQEELLENWELARLGKPLKSIAPLE
jgi:hypothetical protein